MSTEAVDAVIAAADARGRAALEGLRAVIRAAAPDATEALSYGMPGFRAHGRGLVAYAAFKDHYSLFPLGGGIVDAFEAELAGRRVSKGTIHFRYDEPLPTDLVARIVAACLERNAAPVRR
jgi:uncharacterized protein YdhG (YjbR/CyaY superfamily)